MGLFIGYLLDDGDMIDRYWCEEEELRNNWCMAQRRSPASGILVCITPLPPTPSHNIILSSFPICHINTIFLSGPFQTNITLDIRTVFFLLICVTLNFEYPFSQRPIVFFRKKGEGLKLWDCKRCAVKRVITVGIGSQWLVIVRDISFPLGFCQHVQIQSKLAVVPFRKRHSVIPLSRIRIFGNIDVNLFGCPDIDH